MLLQIHIVFELQVCLTGQGLEETLEQISTLACTNSLLFLLHLIYCYHFISFSVAYLTLRQVIKSNFYIIFVGWKFLCIHRNFCNYFWCFCSISSKLLLAVFAGQRHILKVQVVYNTQEASQTLFFGLGNISPLFSFIF